LVETGLFRGLRRKKLKKSSFYLRLHADGSNPAIVGMAFSLFKPATPTRALTADRIHHRRHDSRYFCFTQQ
jgi:hypothetical protein